MTVKSSAFSRSQLRVDDEKSDSVLSASQVKRLARKGARVFLAVIRPVESDSDPPVVASVAALSPDVPTSSVQPDQPAGPPGGEVPWVSELLSEFSEVFQDPLPAGLPPERSEGTVFLHSQVIFLHFGRCTVYLHWNIKSWKSRSPSF
jgi:hypothetical protein